MGVPLLFFFVGPKHYLSGLVLCDDSLFKILLANDRLTGPGLQGKHDYALPSRVIVLGLPTWLVEILLLNDPCF